MADDDDSESAAIGTLCTAPQLGDDLAASATREELRARMFGSARQRPRLGAYELIGPLGEGGMGEVYDARHASTGERVALKVLRGDNPGAASRLKEEFRAVAEIHHPGLVQLGELDAEGPTPFFTMERIEGGVAFDVALRGALETGRHAHARGLLLRLVDALDALHGFGRLHRDLKPSNVLATSEGRVVLLDFGFTSELAADGLHVTERGRIVGTPQFMAPEQLLGQRLSAASDWYAVGAMLAASLLPPVPALRNWGMAAAAAGSSHATTAPEPWWRVCTALCREQPDQRAGPAEIRRLFGAPGQRERPGRGGVFVGRAQAIEELSACVSPGPHGARLIVLEGESGIGKTALLRRFRLGYEARANGVVVYARCRERERAAYKGLDDILVALTRLQPPSIPDVGGGSAREACARTRDLASERFDVEVLRAKLAECAEARSLVVVLEDIQWAGADSLALLADLVAGFDAPAVTWLVSGRAGTADALLALPPLASSEAAVRVLRLEGLADEDAADLVRALDPSADARRVHSLCAAGGGHPRWLAAMAVEQAAPEESPARLYARVIEGVAPAALRILRAASAAAVPLPLELAARAVDEQPRGAALSQQLSSQRLLSMSLIDAEWHLECELPPIRAAALAGLSEAQCMRLHGRLAAELSARPATPPSQLIEHFRQAGAVDRAIDAAERAGDDAQSLLAHASSAAFFGEALELRPSSAEQRSRLCRKRGESLAALGARAEADACFEQAVQSADDPRTLELAVASWRAFQQAMGHR